MTCKDFLKKDLANKLFGIKAVKNNFIITFMYYLLLLDPPNTNFTLVLHFLPLVKMNLRRKEAILVKQITLLHTRFSFCSSCTCKFYLFYKIL